jgi:hypothetical protein
MMACFERWGTRHAGLFTFAQSLKHIGLYQRFGFWPRFLTAIMSKPVARAEGATSSSIRFSGAPANEQQRMLAVCREMTDAVYEGLDVSSDIRAAADQRLGDTLLLSRDGELVALAVCHSGPGTEAGSGTCYIKFGAVRSSMTTRDDFDRLLTECERFAAEQGAARLLAGVNTARHEAYARMLESGFRTQIQGVVMERPNESGYNRPGVYVLDDWR